MCTVVRHRALGLLAKNRDKDSPTEEELVCTPDLVAVRSRGADYFSLAVNRHGCAFAATAVNSPAWTAAAEKGLRAEARAISARDDAGLTRPTAAVSAVAAETRDARAWIELLMRPGAGWLGYNVVVADRGGAFVVECRGPHANVRALADVDAVTNHFSALDHGPRTPADYPSSFQRLEIARAGAMRARSLADVLALVRPAPGTESPLWREAAFRTVSSSVIDVAGGAIHWTPARDRPHRRFGLAAASVP